jgi:hypothetical protein
MDRVLLLLLLTASSCVAVVTGGGLDEARAPWPPSAPGPLRPRSSRCASRFATPPSETRSSSGDGRRPHPRPAFTPVRAFFQPARRRSQRSVRPPSTPRAVACVGLIRRAPLRVNPCDGFVDLCILIQIFSSIPYSFFDWAGSALAHQWPTMPQAGPERPEGP